MKVFWALIAVLAAAAAATLLLTGHSRSTADVLPLPTLTEPAPSSLTVLNRASDPNPAAEPEPPRPRVETRGTFDESPAAATAAPPRGQTEISPATEAHADASMPVAPTATSTEALPSASPAANPSPVHDSAPAAATASATPDAEVNAGHHAAPARPNLRLVRRDDGTLLINDRWVIKGDGSAEKPYEVTWEYLISAGETYDPKAGQNDIPPHISMLDGTHVRITGWIAFPLYVQSATELLVMLNQWDGCCIGVPPTPYDAIEVRLRAPAEGDARQATFGTVQGIMSVQPYVVGGWLVGLYVMDQARIIPGRFNDGGS